jgi:hypothetical protein
MVFDRSGPTSDPDETDDQDGATLSSLTSVCIGNPEGIGGTGGGMLAASESCIMACAVVARRTVR